MSKSVIVYNRFRHHVGHAHCTMSSIVTKEFPLTEELVEDTTAIWQDKGKYAVK